MRFSAPKCAYYRPESLWNRPISETSSLETPPSSGESANHRFLSGGAKSAGNVGVLSVTETTPVADIALLLETNRIKRVPVVRDGKLVGLSR